MHKLPTFIYEKRLWKKGYKIVVGLDEVGRGAWAGPLIVGATVFAPTTRSKIKDKSEESKRNLFIDVESCGVNDSKKLTPKKREQLNDLIKEGCLAWAIAEVPVSVINRLGIGKATQIGFRRAVSHIRKKLNTPVDFILVDAFYVSRLVGLPQGRGKGKLALTGKVRRGGRQLPIIKGDQKSISIAAASIIAKVYRDNLMEKLSCRDCFYGWERNKGYGTAEHQAALRRHGLSRFHRKQFVATGMKNSNLIQ